MVHALLSARRVLTTGGLLIDIHPEPDQPVILYGTPAGQVVVGRLRESRRRYLAARRSLARVAASTAFRRGQSRVFTFLHEAASLAVLDGYLARTWDTASLGPRIARAITRLARARPGGRIIVAERVRITVLVKP
jgi:hypothetical protein